MAPFDAAARHADEKANPQTQPQQAARWSRSDTELNIDQPSSRLGTPLRSEPQVAPTDARRGPTERAGVTVVDPRNYCVQQICTALTPAAAARPGNCHLCRRRFNPGPAHLTKSLPTVSGIRQWKAMVAFDAGLGCSSSWCRRAGTAPPRQIARHQSCGQVRLSPPGLPDPVGAEVPAYQRRRRNKIAAADSGGQAAGAAKPDEAV